MQNWNWKEFDGNDHKKRDWDFLCPQGESSPCGDSLPLLFALSPAGNHPPSLPSPSLPFPSLPFPSIPLLFPSIPFSSLQFVDQSRRPMRGATRFPNAFSPFIFFVFFQSIPILQAQCPRKTAASNSGPPDGQNGHQPGIRPPSQFIQTTFVHRDIDDFDREYSQFFAIKLAELRPRLAKEASLSLDNENVDCARGDAHFEYRCREYPLQRAFHFLVVEDSRTGAAVYSFPRERNWVENGRAETIGRLEMAILDALSRHSAHPLIGFASEQASARLGFLRELSAAELEQQIRENEQKLMASQNPSKSSAAPILTRSPLEMRLLNGRILAKRRVDFSLEGAGLLEIEGPELAELIEADHLHAVFVLFWSRKSELSKHAFQIWAKTAQKWRNENRREDIVLGAVDCQREGELCRAFGIFHSQREHLHHWMAFRLGHRMGQQLEIGTPQFLVEWMKILLAGPLIRLEPGQIAKAREGILPGFEEVEALSLGQFRDEQQEEFRRFRRAAAFLAGRYYFAYWLEPTKDEARLSIFRRAKGQGDNGMEERIFGGGNFDLRSLLNHITHSSMPEILDIGRGFTTDLAIRPAPSILFLHDSREKGDGELRRNFAGIVQKFGANKGNRQLLAFLELDRANSLPLDEFEAQIGMKNAQNWPAICALNLREIRCGFGLEAGRLEGDGFVEAIQKLIDSQNDEEIWNWSGLETHFPHQILLDLANRPHLLTQIQMEQIHDIFGRQQFQIDPLPMVELEKMMKHRGNSADQHHPHNLANMDSSGSISGCPMMAHFNNLHDEL